MSRDELIKQLQTIANDCDESDEQQAVKSVLLSTMAAICSRREMALMNHVCRFTEREMIWMTAQRN